MDNHIEGLPLCYMWKVVQDKVLHLEIFAIKALDFFLLFLVVDFDIFNNLCKIQNKNQWMVFPKNQMLQSTKLLPNPYQKSLQIALLFNGSSAYACIA